MKDEKGFTLMESLGVVAIILVILSITLISINCYMKSAELEETKVMGNQIMFLLESAYSDNGKIPLGNKVTKLDEAVIKDAEDKITSIRSIVEKGFLYEIDYEGLNTGKDINKKDTDKFYVVYIEDIEDSKLNPYIKYNLSLVTKDICETCTDNTFSNIVGKSPYNNIPKSLKFEVSDDYLKCPNSGLYFKLNGEDCNLNEEGKNVDD